MDSFIKAMDDLPKTAKIILAIPFLDIIWVVYRLCKSIKQNYVPGIVVASLLIILGIPFLWLVDVITLLVYNKVWWFEQSTN